MIKQENSYSLWLRPKQTQIDELTKIISKLSHNYHRIPFPAHITLLHSLSTDLDTITKACEEIIEQHTAFDIILGDIAHTEAYFKNLFIPAKPESLLIGIYDEIKNRLKHETHEVYMPHVSLYYGKLEVNKKQAIKEELRNRYPKIFNCQRIDLYNTTGKEGEWYLIDSFNLKKQQIS